MSAAFAWARNLRTGDRIDVRRRGRPSAVEVRVPTAEPEVTKLYGVIARANHHFAGFNRITLDAHGEPVETGLHRCWAEGARVLRLIPR